MANPQIPIQTGSSLPALDHDENVHRAEDQDDDLKAYEESLDLDPEEIEQEVIELDDGSVIVNFQEKRGPQKDPEFYENLAHIFDEEILQSLAIEYLDYIDVDQESRKQRDKHYEEGLRRTGLGKDAPGGATFDGASKVVHPIMAEACVDFAANSANSFTSLSSIFEVFNFIYGKTLRALLAICQPLKPLNVSIPIFAFVFCVCFE